MSDTIRWLHLSDIHIGKDNYAQVDLLEKIIVHVRTEVSSGNVPDFVFVTGDVANRGDKKEYETFRRHLYVPLMDALGENWTGRFFTVPGNHDVQRPPSDALDPAKLSSPGSKFFDPTADGKVRRDAQVIPRFNNYKKLVPSSATNDWVATKDAAFSEQILVRGHRVGVVGINTAWLAMGEKDQGKLTPGLPIVEAALKKVNETEVCIVLGHHPIDWMLAEQQPPLRALFGEHGIIYLHGHMHKADGRPEDGAGNGFLVVQAGAAFQTRVDDPVYKNGLLWGELDLKQRRLRLSPRFYNADNRDWPIEAGRFPETRKVPQRADWWEFPLPASSRHSPASFLSPLGWNFFNALGMSAMRRELAAGEAEKYFDGAEPDWATVLSPKLPQRQIVAKLTERLRNDANQERPLVMVIAGPSGEGKSTALRQTVANLAQSDWRVIWRTDADAPLPLAILDAIPRDGGPWLIATDAADMQVVSLYQAAVALAKRGQSNVRFLLCVRGTDWTRSGASLDWGTLRLEIETLSGITAGDAALIAKSWIDFDAAPANQEVDALAAALVAAATKEAALGEGALLGGVLLMRRGAAGLRSHVHQLLTRLELSRLKSGKNLRDAAAYIAAMHAEDMDFLSRPVLAEVLGCANDGELKSKVLVPLGREAAATGGTFLRTRHRRIALEMASILEDELGYASEDYLLELAQAAAAIRSATFVPQFSKWQFELPDNLLAKRKIEAAIKISRSMLDIEPNSRLAVHLAHIYRGSGDPEAGLLLLERLGYDIERGYLHEWATCAGAAGNPALSAWLGACSVADYEGLASPDNDRAKLSLAGIGVAFRSLAVSYNYLAFNDGLMCIAQLGEKLRLDPKTASYFQTHWREASESGSRPANSLEEIFFRLDIAVSRAWDCCADRSRLSARLLAPSSIRFTELRRLFEPAFAREIGSQSSPEKIQGD